MKERLTLYPEQNLIVGVCKKKNLRKQFELLRKTLNGE
jgi:hypothetical protein